MHGGNRVIGVVTDGRVRTCYLFLTYIPVCTVSLVSDSEEQEGERSA